MIYTLFIKIYYSLILIASCFNAKAKQWIYGRKHIFNTLENQIPEGKLIWFHCSSLGEFEQGRPLIEMIKKHKKDYKILLTFFSPSGYNIRKNYAYADIVTYLPLDTPKKTEKFIRLVKPTMVFFVKYDFWFNIIKNLHKNKIPIYLISGIFNKNQLFFKRYGRWYKKILFLFDHLFVQDDDSRILLQKQGLNNVTVAGDTRFDRVYEIAQKVEKNPLIEKFKNNHRLIIGGSSWEQDENILLHYINETDNDQLCYIIAPHEINPAHINNIINKLNKKALKYSEANQNNIENYKVLIIDNVGMLSSLYQYAEIAFIGGGFGKGIHNILEPATFGIPVIFGPCYHKFREAHDLINGQAAKTINNYDTFKKNMTLYLDNHQIMIKAGNTAAQYVKNNKGATAYIYEKTLQSSV